MKGEFFQKKGGGDKDNMADDVCMGGKASNYLRVVKGLDLGCDTEYPDFLVLLPKLSRKIPRHYLRSGHDPFLPQHFQFITRSSSNHSII
jgi:hypothetical protein